jgi:dihydroorotate dehydrogenase (NAD+) catalytic subunit
MSKSLTLEIAGLKLQNPTMLASGILGLSATPLERIVEGGAAAVVTKSVGLNPRIGYANPTIVQTECGVINAMGLPNPGIEVFAAEIQEMKKLGVPIIVSIYGFSPGEFAETAARAVEAGADAVELNLSCPHVKKTGAEIGVNPQLAAEVVKKVKDKVDAPVFAKLTPNTVDITKLAVAVEKAGADAVTAINTVRAMAIDIETAKPILANKFGGLSGPAIKPIAVRCVYEIYREVRVPIIGCGGITSWQDAVEFLLAGASAIQIGTAIAFRGLQIFAQIVEGIKEYMAKKDFRSVTQIVGMAHKG